jgi:bifunctional UDP-N-acetylglucosamine pyrophosphorylase/glucosamine-1-phosphate N-acetyltransferase
MALEVVVLAAGMGTRMRSSVPKVLHPIGGEPMLQRVLDAVAELSPSRIHVIVGNGHEQVRAALADPTLNYVLQAEQKGTGHAVQQVAPHLGDSQVLILYGDVPLITAGSLHRLVDAGTARFGLMTALMDDPTGLGRILRSASGKVLGIREQKDASPDERRINEINTGLMVVPSARLAQWLARLQPNNAQGEYYLTDIVAMAVEDGVDVVTTQPDSVDETGGINDRVQLAAAERIWQKRQVDALMRSGTTMYDPSRVDIRGKVIAGQDCVIDVNTVFEGTVVLGERVRIGPHCVIRNASLGDDCVVESNTSIDGAVLDRKVTVGPFARLRPGTRLADSVRIGNFVETKKAVLGIGSKANHLAYLGDTTMGSDCNIGAGTITCNYDGIAKHRTELGDHVFVGSNSTLVAPVTLETDAFVAAGSTITSKVPSNSLAVGRGRQRNIDGWVRPDQRPTHSDDD